MDPKKIWRESGAKSWGIRSENLGNPKRICKEFDVERMWNWIWQLTGKGIRRRFEGNPKEKPWRIRNVNPMLNPVGFQRNLKWNLIWLKTGIGKGSEGDLKGIRGEILGHLKWNPVASWIRICMEFDLWNVSGIKYGRWQGSTGESEEELSSRWLG